MIGTLAVDGCAATYIWYSEEKPGQAAAPPSPLLAVRTVTAHPLTANVPISYYSTWQYNCLCALKGQQSYCVPVCHVLLAGLDHTHLEILMTSSFKGKGEGRQGGCYSAAYVSQTHQL